MPDKIKIGDEIFFQHSNCKETGVIGVMQVVNKYNPYHTALIKKSK